jgi:hypothetical protein
MEAGVMRELVQNMHTLIDSGTGKNDPVLERIFPAAYEDASEEQRYQAVVGDSLREAKKEALAEVSAGLGDKGRVRVTLTEQEASTWLSVLTDMRLAIATRLDVTEEVMAADVDPSSPDAPALSVLHWLGWLQESMLEALQTQKE